MVDSVFSNKRNVTFIAIFYTFLWGCAFPLVKLCMAGLGVEDNMSKCLVAGIRFFISGSALTVFCFAKQKKEAALTKSEAIPAICYGVLGTALQYTFTYIGLSAVDSSKGAIFDQLCVFIIIIISGLFMKNDKLTIIKIIGCIVGFLGILAVNTEKMGFSFTLGGEGMMILASLCQAGAYMVATLSAGRIPAVKLVGYGQLSGGAMLILFALLAGGKISTISPIGIFSLLALAAISAVAYILSLIPLKYFPASEISAFNLLITVFGVVMSGIVLGESIFKLNYLVSFLLISIGILAVNYKGEKNGNNI